MSFTNKARATVILGLEVPTGIFPASGEDPESLMRSADRAMYEAKSAGGGAVCSHRPEPRAGQ